MFIFRKILCKYSVDDSLGNVFIPIPYQLCKDKGAHCDSFPLALKQKWFISEIGHF